MGSWGRKETDAMLRIEGNRIVFHYDAEEMWVEPWGENAVRIRATKQAAMPKEDWALLPLGESV